MTSRFRFAYSTNAYTNFPLTDAVEDVARAGFEAVEILADLPHAFPGSFNAVGALQEQLKRLGLEISNLNCNTSHGLDPQRRDPEGFWPSLLDPDPDVRGLRIESLKRSIDLARDLGAFCICTASGRLPTGVSELQAMDLFADGLTECLRYAETAPGVRIGIEFEPGFFIGDTPSLLRLLQRVHHPLLGANLDVGHAVCVGEDPAESIRKLGGRIWNIHLEDIRGRVHDHLIPGLGTIDFARLRPALQAAKYDRFLTLELYPYKDDPGEAGRRGLTHLRPLFS